MAIRTNSTNVKLIISTGLTDGQVDAFIADASLWVDNNLVGEGLSSDTLTAIEKYLAAHLITLRDPVLTERRRDDITDKFGLRTSYLSYAMQLDPTGKIEEDFGEDRPAFSFRVGAGYDSELSKLPTNSS